MISRLRGILIQKQPPWLLVDVGGVGYEVQAPMSTFYQLPELNSEVVLLTHLSIRDDAHVLYGFHRETERRLFRELIKINGVGPKLALSVLSAMDDETFTQCVNNGDTAMLTKISGVGKKTAERLLVEMRDKLGEHLSLDSTTGSLALTSNTTTVVSAVADAESALIALGYKSQEAARLVKLVAEPDADSETLIRKALKAAI